VRTRRFGTLTYSRSSASPEDISLFDRSRQKNIAVYTSADRLAARGRFYRGEDLAEFDVRDYDIDLAFDPERRWFEGRARIKLTIGSKPTSQIALHLAPALAVQSVTSEPFGRLFSIRVRNQDTLVITLPALLLPDTDITITVAYAGASRRSRPTGKRAPTSGTRSAAEQRPPPGAGRPPGTALPTAISFGIRDLGADYATATLRLTIPSAFDCVASGELSAEPQTVIDDEDPLRRRKVRLLGGTPAPVLSFFVTGCRPSSGSR
jgi:hypothetical protein